MLVLIGKKHHLFLELKMLLGGRCISVRDYSCNHTMRFSTFLKKWNPPQYRKYEREKELAKKNYQPKFLEVYLVLP